MEHLKPSKTIDAEPIVYLVDDDEDFGHYLGEVLSSYQIRYRYFADPDKFLADQELSSRSGCVLLDLVMPGLDGIKVMEKLAERQIELPIIFMSGFGSVKKVVEAVQKGAVDFLEKPIPRDILLERVQSAFATDLSRRQTLHARRDFQVLFDNLTPRECEIFRLVARGKSNKSIASFLEISPRTIETHRKRIMSKMKFHGFEQLLTAAKALGIS